MVNKEGVRELAYVVRVETILPIENADRLELVKVGEWKAVVGKGDFHIGDLAVYFETDSKLPEVAPFTEMEFLVSKHYKIKVQKLRGVVSDGLLVPIGAFGWTEADHPEGTFVTKELNVTYNDPEDVARKSAPNPDEKYKRMSQRHQKLFKLKPFRWLMRRPWGRKLLYVFFGKKRDNGRGFPVWEAENGYVLKKTDEERIQNIPWRFSERDENGNKIKWIPTEKIDGTSTTFAMKRSNRFGNKYDFYTCSRNVVFDKKDKKCYYDVNVYTEMGEKYKMEETLESILNADPTLKWVALQAETYGASVQKRDYGMKDRDMMAFNYIDSKNGRWNSEKASEFWKQFGVKWVPILSEPMELPDTFEELMAYVEGEKSKVDGGMREGVVFRSLDGNQSFKCVSDKFRLKYHS